MKSKFIQKQNIKFIFILFQLFGTHSFAIQESLFVLLRRYFVRCQFHQHFKLAFFIQKCFVQLFSSYSLASNFLRKNIGAKADRRMLMKLTIGSCVHSTFSFDRGSRRSSNLCRSSGSTCESMLGCFLNQVCYGISLLS